MPTTPSARSSGGVGGPRGAAVPRNGVPAGGRGPQPRARYADSAQAARPHRPLPAAPHATAPQLQHGPAAGAVVAADSWMRLLSDSGGSHPAGPLVEGSGDVVLNETFRGRLAALMDLRVKIEALAAQHREEEQSFVSAMRQLLRHATDERHMQQSHVRELEDRLGRYEGLLQSEEREKSKAMEMVATFKQEGGQIMERLRESLRESGRQCADLQRRSDRLEEERREQQRRHAQREQQLEGQLREYQSLLGEQERLVAQLKDRNAQLELQLRHAGQLLNDLSAEDVFNQDYQEMICELKGVDRTLASPRTPVLGRPGPRAGSAAASGGDDLSGDSPAAAGKRRNTGGSLPSGFDADDSGAEGPGGPRGSLQHKMRLQGQIIQMLYAKLQSERRHRLETEEQAANMVAAEEDTIRKLEDRVRDLERAQGPNTPRLGHSDTPRPAAPQQQQQLQQAMDMTPASATAPSPSAPGASDGPRSRSGSGPAAEHAGAATEPTPPSPPPPQRAVAPAPAAPRAVAPGPGGRGALVSLEAQLAEVTRDFNDSLEMWNTRLAGHAAAGLPGDDTADFLPETPRRRGAGDEADFLPDSPDPAACGAAGPPAAPREASGSGHGIRLSDL